MTFVKINNTMMDMYKKNKNKNKIFHIYFGVDFEIIGFYTHHCQNSQFCFKIATNSHYLLAIDFCEYAKIKYYH